MKRSTLALTALAGAALIETALVPGVALGLAAYLARGLLAKRLRRAQVAIKKTAAPVKQEAAGAVGLVSMRRAFFKTITFRVIVSSLDFTSNIVALGELGPAMGLSAYGLVAGPLFYLAHEMVWNRMRKPAGDEKLAQGDKIAGRLKVNQTLAKTITYRLFATTTDFTANFVTVRDLTTAAGLTAFGFVVGPFVYYGHEKLWDRFPERRAVEGPKLLRQQVTLAPSA